MTTDGTFEVPEPAEYGPADFETATSRVRVAADTLLTNPRAARAHQQLAEQIAAHIAKKSL